MNAHSRADNTYMRWPKGAPDKESVEYVNNMKVIEDLVGSDEPELRDLLHKLLEIGNLIYLPITTCNIF